MSEGKLKVKSGGVLNSEVLFDARSDELLVLVAVMDAPYRYESAESAFADAVTKFTELL